MIPNYLHLYENAFLYNYQLFEWSSQEKRTAHKFSLFLMAVNSCPLAFILISLKKVDRSAPATRSGPWSVADVFRYRRPPRADRPGWHRQRFKNSGQGRSRTADTGLFSGLRNRCFRLP
jgi:hypothetical protein